MLQIRLHGVLETSRGSVCRYLSCLNIRPLVIGGFNVFLVLKWKDVKFLSAKAGEFSLHSQLGCICNCFPYVGVVFIILLGFFIGHFPVFFDLML